MRSMKVKFLPHLNLQAFTNIVELMAWEHKQQDANNPCVSERTRTSGGASVSSFSSLIEFCTQSSVTIKSQSRRHT